MSTWSNARLPKDRIGPGGMKFDQKCPPPRPLLPESQLLRIGLHTAYVRMNAAGKVPTARVACSRVHGQSIAARLVVLALVAGISRNPKPPTSQRESPEATRNTPPTPPARTPTNGANGAENASAACGDRLALSGGLAGKCYRLMCQALCLSPSKDVADNLVSLSPVACVRATNRTCARGTGSGGSLKRFLPPRS